jgi:hypothetical protein
MERCPRIESAPDGLFEGEEAVRHRIEHIVGPLGIRVDESSRWADARLPDGRRVQTEILSTQFRPDSASFESALTDRRDQEIHGEHLGAGEHAVRQHVLRERRCLVEDHDPARRRRTETK